MQKPQPLICETRVLTSSMSDSSMPERLTVAARFLIASMMSLSRLGSRVMRAVIRVLPFLSDFSRRRRSDAQLCDEVLKGTKLVRIGDRIEALYAFAVGFDGRDGVQATLVERCDRRLAVHGHDAARCAQMSASRDRKPQPRDALRTNQRAAHGQRLAAAIGHHDRVAREQRDDLVAIASIRGDEEPLQHALLGFLIDEVALSSGRQTLARS